MNERELFGRGRTDEVVCIACRETVPRSDAREYDKYGDRWTRDGKAFEYLCKPCHRECCHQPRDGLEATLCRSGAGETDRRSFLRRYRDEVTGGRGHEVSEGSVLAIPSAAFRHRRSGVPKRRLPSGRPGVADRSFMYGGPLE